MAFQLLPEFFALIGTDLFLLLSLATCLLDTRFPKMLPYVFEVAALAGFGHLLISKDFLAVFGEYMRFWYSFTYLLVALASILATNAYLMFIKHSLNIARVWSGTVTFPSILISAYFVYQYTLLQSSTLLLITEIALLLSAALIAIGVGVMLSPEIIRKRFSRAKEVN
jgi:hypothetical protein